MVQYPQNANIFGFYRKENPVMITNDQPRIFIGINTCGTIKRLGHRVIVNNNQLSLGFHFYDIEEDIVSCTLNTVYMEEQDIQFLKLMKIC